MAIMKKRDGVKFSWTVYGNRCLRIDSPRLSNSVVNYKIIQSVEKLLGISHSYEIYDWNTYERIVK